MPDPHPPTPRVVETSTRGFDAAAPTPATPSERAHWDRERHGEALEFHRQQNDRAGMDEVARRNQYCPACRGVVDWRAESCPHCKAPIPQELRDYYNFSDFEAPVDRSDLLPILTVLALALGVLAAAVWVGFAILRRLL